MVKRWEQDATGDVGYRTILETAHIRSLLGPYIASGRRLDITMPEIRLKVEADETLDDFFAYGLWKLVSPTIKDIVSLRTPLSAQFIPVKVQHYLVETQYFIMNVVDKVECFDFQNSHYLTHSLSGGKRMISRIDKTVLLPVDITTHQLFRVADIDPIVICVSNEIAAAIVEARCSGVAFSDVEINYKQRQSELPD